MNKADIINEVSKKTGMTKKDVEREITEMLKIIIEDLAGGNKVRLVGFGVFEVKDRGARVGRNPKTLEVIKIPETKIAVLRPGKSLKEAILTGRKKV